MSFLQVAPTLGDVGTTTLAYPASGAAIETLILPTPMFGNKHTLNQQRVQRKTQGGRTIIFRDSGWNNQDIFTLSFEGLSEALKDSFLDFLELSLGKKVKYIDHENRTWIGIILNPGEATTCVLNYCGWVISFEYMVTQ